MINSIKLCLPNLIAVIMMCGAIGCGDYSETRKVLDDAERLMPDYPDSSLLLLENMESSALTDARTSARYALLLTQARHKNYMEETGDSLINTAVNYYQKCGPKRELHLALFYQGIILYNAGNYSAAIVPAMQAIELAGQLRDDYWTARTSELMADIFDATYHNDESLKYRDIAIEHYLKTGNVCNCRYALCDKAITLNNIEQTRDGVILLDSLLSLPCEYYADSLLVAECIKAKIPMAYYLRDYPIVKYLTKALKNYRNYYNVDCSEFIYEIEAYLALGEMDVYSVIDSAVHYAHTIDDRMMMNNMWTHYWKNVGDFKKALIYSDSLLLLQNEVVRNILQQSVVVAQRDFFDKQAEAAHNHIVKMRWLSITGIILAILLFLAYRHHKNSLLERRMNEIWALSVSRDRVESAFAEKLLRGRWETINKLCNDFFEQDGSEYVRRMLVRNVEKEIARISNNLPKIESEVNSCMGDIVAKLRAQCPFLKPADVAFITWIYAGFAPRAVCLFTGIKLKNFYNKRSRLKDRILSSDAVNKELFASKIG